MAVDTQVPLERRAPVPSEREQSLGITVPQASFDAVEQPAAQRRTGRDWLRTLVRDADPRQALSGESVRPVATLGANAITKGFAYAMLAVSTPAILFDLGVGNGAVTIISAGTTVGSCVLGLLVAYL